MMNMENLLTNLDSLDSCGELSGSRYYKPVSAIQQYIHGGIPEYPHISTRRAASVSFRQDRYQGVNYKKAVIFLMSNGCEWALKDGHGCAMCGHIAKQTRQDRKIPGADYISQLDQEFEMLDFKEYPILGLFNNGSFLNDNEIPSSARIQILKKINARQDIKMVVLETRPEFVTEKRIKEIRDLLSDKYVEIAVGLELKSDLYRTICLNKGFSLQRYNTTAALIARHLHLRTYVFLKPPLLTEEESIREAVETVEHAFHAGSSTVSLEGCTIQDYTLVKYLYDRHLYQPPWLWSILEVIKQTWRKGQLVAGLFQFYPSPSSVPHNCDSCSQTVLAAICRYNETLDEAAFHGLTCQCKEKWQKLLKEKPIPFEKRLAVYNTLKNEMNRKRN